MAETKPISTADSPPRAGTRTEGETAPTEPPAPTPTQAEADAIRLGDAGLEPPPPPPEGSTDPQARADYEAAKKEYDEREKNLPPAAREARDRRRKELKEAADKAKARQERRDYGGRGPTPTPYENR